MVDPQNHGGVDHAMQLAPSLAGAIERVTHVLAIGYVGPLVDHLAAERAHLLQPLPRAAADFAAAQQQNPGLVAPGQVAREN